jgi:OmpA-OmpF porin, OOP family
MKKNHIAVLWAAFLLLTAPAYAQLNIGRKLQDKINQKIDQQVDKTIDGTLKTSTKKATATESGSEAEEAAGSSDGSATSTPEAKKKAWTKYDFIAGDKVLFADNLAGEENGEFPSRWDLNDGNAEVALFGGEPVINLVQNGTEITPLMKNKNWVPETFTIEFDVYFDNDNGNVAYEVYLIEETNNYNESLHGDFWDPIDIRPNAVRFKTFGSASEEMEAAGTKNQ